MSRTMMGIVAIVLLVLYLATLLQSRAHIVRLAVHTIRSYPRGHRGRATWFILKALAKRRTPPPAPRTPEEASLRTPDEPLRTVPYEQWNRVDNLVANARNVTTGESRTQATSLDVDGSVVVVKSRDDTTSDIGVLAPDGSTYEVTGPDGAVSASRPRPSIDNGTVAWWQVALDGKSATLWAAPRGSAPRTIHTELLPGGRPKPWEPFGWVIVTGDWVAWTILTRGVTLEGTIGATSMDGITFRLGTTRFPTLHRDSGAERQGRRAVAVNVADGELSIRGQLAEIDLNGPVPAMRILKADIYPGASVCNGSVVGYWSPVRVLQLPDGVWVPMPLGTSATDIVSDGEWCAGLVFNPADATTKNIQVCELFHLPTGARQRLSDSRFGMVDLRGDRVLWSWAASDKDDRCRTSWVGDLLAPAAPEDPATEPLVNPAPEAPREGTA